MDKTIISQLKSHLQKCPKQQVEVTKEFERLLSSVWDKFDGHDDHGMTARKLFRARRKGEIVIRIENPQWNDPILTFEIERHGATVLGSGRAEIHTWTLDFDALTASCEVSGRRQLRPASRRVDIETIATQLADLIEAKQPDEHLRRRSDDSVEVLTAKVFPSGSASKTTVASRRKRLMESVTARLIPKGWSPSGRNAFKE